MSAHLRHRRDQPHLSLLELPCPCCDTPTVPSIQHHACRRHPWSSAPRYLVGWFCSDCDLPIRVLRLHARGDNAYDFLASLHAAARDGWEHGHAPDLPAWILPRRRLSAAPQSPNPASS